jgi:hypothetical protein
MITFIFCIIIQETKSVGTGFIPPIFNHSSVHAYYTSSVYCMGFTSASYHTDQQRRPACPNYIRETTKPKTAASKCMGTIKSETQSFTWCMHLLPFYLMESKAAAHQLWTSTNSGRYMGSGTCWSGCAPQRQPLLQHPHRRQ